MRIVCGRTELSEREDSGMEIICRAGVRERGVVWGFRLFTGGLACARCSHGEHRGRGDRHGHGRHHRDHRR